MAQGERNHRRRSGSLSWNLFGQRLDATGAAGLTSRKMRSLGVQGGVTGSKPWLSSQRVQHGRISESLKFQFDKRID